MSIDFLIELFEENKDKEAIIWKDRSYSYQWLLDRVQYCQDRNRSQNILPGSVTVLEGDFTPNTIALLLSLIQNRCIIVPITRSVFGERPSGYIETAQGEVLMTVGENDNREYMQLPNSANHEFYRQLREQNHPGLVLFTSGSTGDPKAAVHDFQVLLEKFRVRRHSDRTINFLRFDHWGGLNTLFHILSNAGTVITVQERTPAEICRIIERYRVEVLPTSPTFLNLLLLSEEYKRYDLSSLKTISYGTESMQLSTLKRLKTLFPATRLHQTYGLIEVGVLRTKSRDDGSLWVKIGGEGFETRVVDGMLEIKARSAMLGYLNAPIPFTEDGWFKTGDIVEVDGEYLHILGRKSEIINVGGEKVYPVEVEDVLQLIEGVEDVVVSGEPSPITGQMVVARVKLNTGESLSDFRRRMHTFCKDKLQGHKIPQKVILVDKALYGERFKKMRLEAWRYRRTDTGSLAHSQAALDPEEAFVIEAIEVQKREMIRKAGMDEGLKALSLDWIIGSGKYLYSYNFTWMGRPIIQFPQDIIAMQEIIWHVKPDLIVETGIAHGGSLVFYASMLELIGGNGQALGIDVDIREHNRVEIERHSMFKRILMIEGASTNEEVVRQVYEFARGKKPVLVALDSNHTHDHVFRELNLYSPLVTKGSYLVVFDTVIEDMPDNSFPDRPWGKGNNPKTAVWEFLKMNDRFVIDKDIEHKLLVTVAPDGYLKCVKD